MVGVGVGMVVGSGFRVGVGMVVEWVVACGGGLVVVGKTAVGTRVGKAVPSKQPLKSKTVLKKNNR